MKTIKYDPDYGMHISSAIKEAIQLSIKKDCFVEVTFNGTGLFIDHTESCDTNYWISLWNKVREAESLARKSTPENKARELKREQELLDVQCKVKNFMKIFEYVDFKCGLSLDAWFEEFIPLSDYCGVRYDKQLLIDTLEKLGYTKGAYVGYDGVWDTYKSRMWIYGQILDGLKSGHGIHPILADKLKGLEDE